MREEQRALRERLRVLDERLVRFETQAAADVRKVDLAPETPAFIAHVGPEIPPPLPPPTVEKPIDPVRQPTAPRPLPAKSAPVAPIAEPVPSTPRESLEMRIGTVWLVRAGVVAVLTALVFAGTALYQNLVPRIGPAAKVAFLYLGAGALTGLGAWLERGRQARENPRLRNYAQVVFGGGLAAVYYVTYAAHYVDRLRVIPNALFAGTLLLAWTAFMVLLAHRRNSETLASVAILLAFYTAAVNEGVAAFTLGSNLILAGAAAWLLRRHLWRIFPFTSVLATFGSYGFWTYHASLLGGQALGGPPVHAAHGEGGFWVEAAFLFVYWALFTWAAFTAPAGVLPAFRRAGFVSLNNGAFFLLTTWLVLGQGPGWFWKWSLGFGVVLLALAEACRRLPRPADPKTEDAYLLQGVALVTTGLVAYFDGWQLGMVLAIQALMLLAAADRRANVWLLGGSMVNGLLAFVRALRSFMDEFVHGGWLTPLAVGGFLVAAAFLAQRSRNRPTVAASAGAAFRRALEPTPAYFSLLGCAVWFILVGDQAPGTNSGILLFVGAALVLTALVYFLRIGALPVYAQVFLAAGGLIWGSATLSQPGPASGPIVWTTLGPLVGALALGHWWQWLPGNARWTPGKFSRFVSASDALAAVGVVFVWFVGHVWSETRAHNGVLAAASASLSLMVFIYAAATRYRALAAASQALLLLAVGLFFKLVLSCWSGDPREAILAAVPLAVLLLTLTGLNYLSPQDRWSRALRVQVYLYEGLATVVFLVWALHYLPAILLLPVGALAGALVFTLSIGRQTQRWTLWSIAPTVMGLCCYLGATYETRGSFLTLPGLLILAAQQQFGRLRTRGSSPVRFTAGWQNALMIATTLCGWIFISERAGRWHGSAFTLAASWSVFAAVVFVAGMFLKEKIYRWAGLLVMGATFAHLFLFDIMQLDNLGKAVGFFALASVLLSIGFLYNKYQSRFRDLL